MQNVLIRPGRQWGIPYTEEVPLCLWALMRDLAICSDTEIKEGRIYEEGR